MSILITERRVRKERRGKKYLKNSAEFSVLCSSALKKKFITKQLYLIEYFRQD